MAAKATDPISPPLASTSSLPPTSVPAATKPTPAPLPSKKKKKGKTLPGVVVKRPSDENSAKRKVSASEEKPDEKEGSAKKVKVDP